MPATHSVFVLEHFKRRNLVNRLISIGLLVSFNWGCSVVYSEQPIGSDPHIDPLAWEGVWMELSDTDTKDAIRVHVIDTASGELLITPAVADDECRVAHAFVRRQQDWTFVSIACGDPACSESCPSDDPVARYFWGVAEIDSDVLLVWTPVTERIADLVDDGRLPGERDGMNVMLRALEPDHYQALMSGEYGAVFDWRRPLILRRISTESPAEFTR